MVFGGTLDEENAAIIEKGERCSRLPFFVSPNFLFWPETGLARASCRAVALLSVEL
ncbi:MAG: hypothetical protein JOY97_11310 [Hyphomicrobiales bacterium]|nr:hypothetical protein [Hyphomicrobiales bacterium]